MSRLPVRCALLLVLGLPACSGGPRADTDLRLTVLARNTAPLNQLDGVELGMSLSRLRAARPAIAYADSVGFVEVVERDTLVYQLYDPSPRAHSETDSTLYLDTSPLLAVELRQQLAPSDTAALRVWRQTVRAFEPDNGTPACFEAPGRDSPVGAAWESSAHGIAVVLMGSGAGAGGVARERSVSSRLMVVVASSLTGSVAGYESRTQRACP